MMIANCNTACRRLDGCRRGARRSSSPTRSASPACPSRGLWRGPNPETRHTPSVAGNPTIVSLSSRSPRVSYALLARGGTHLRGAGQGATTLQEAPGLPGSVRLLYVTGDDIRIEDLTLDGNKANQTVDEHRACIFATQTNRLLVQH